MATVPRDVKGPGVRASATADATLRALDALLGPRDFTVRLWDGTVAEPATGSSSRFTLVLAHPGSLWRMMWPPGELTAAEAFVRGDYDVEGDLIAAIWAPRPAAAGRARGARLPAARAAAGARGRGGPAGAVGAAPRRPAHARARRGGGAPPLRGRERVLRALARRRMVYSCAYFPDAAATSTRRRRRSSSSSAASSGSAAASGSSTSAAAGAASSSTRGAPRRRGARDDAQPAQAQLARERIARARARARCRVEVADYRGLREEPFDKVASVGMVEPVGVAQLPVYFRQAFGS